MMTAQDLFKHVMRDHITPALRDLGFRGSWYRSLWYQDGDYLGTLWTQKSVHSTKDHVSFTVHLSAGHGPTSDVYWTRSLLRLIPGNRDPWWTVHATDSAEPAAARFVAAATDSPGFPPEPDGRWARTFPRAAGTVGGNGPPALEPIAWALQPIGGPADQWFAMLNDDSDAGRINALRLITELAADDPRTLPVLLDRLEHDPSHLVREDAAAPLLASRARDQPVPQALRDAARQDEDLQVRWAARYAIRLATSEET
jgi:hypothetical protein